METQGSLHRDPESKPVVCVWWESTYDGRPGAVRVDTQ